MKKIILVVVVLAIIATLLVLGNKDIDENAREVKVGATLALTGPLAFIGEAEHKGLQLAAEEINENGGIDGRRLNLIIEDNGGQAPAGVSNAQKLLSVDNVDVIFSAFTHVTQAVAEVVRQANKPMVYASSLASIAESSDLFFRDYFDAVNLGNILGKEIAAGEYTKVAYLGETNDACEPYIAEVKKILKEEKGIETLVVEERFAADSTDFRSQLGKMKAAGVDAIVTCTFRKSDIFMKQLKELEMMDVATFQTVAPFLPNGDTAEMRALYEENGSVSTWYGFSQGSLNEAQQAFSERFEKRFGVKPNSDSAFAYDDLMLIAKNVEQCFSDDGLDNACFSEHMVSSVYEGVGGKLSFNDQGVSQRDGILIRVENAQWVSLD